MDSYLTSQYESTHMQVKDDWNFSDINTNNDYNTLFGIAVDGVFFEPEESMLSAMGVCELNHFILHNTILTHRVQSLLPMTDQSVDVTL